MLIGYARVSTRHQDSALQEDALNKAGCETIFTETASGAQRDRPQLREALKYAREGDVVVVWRLDRLARSLKQLIETVEDLDVRGIGFKSLTENIDTTTAGSRLVFHIFGAMGEFERELIRERTLAGLEKARESGVHLGNQAKLTDRDVEAAKAMIGSGGMTVKEVAEKLGVSRATLYRYLPKAASTS